MIAIDTNILIRYLTQDDEEQAKIASNLLYVYNGKKRSIFLNNIVMCEVIWVLDRGYKSGCVAKFLENLYFMRNNKNIMYQYEQKTYL